MGSVISFILPILTPLGTWAIKTFILDKTRKQELLDSYYAWIESHKTDGENSAEHGTLYQSQIDELKRLAAEKDAAQGGQDGSSSTQKKPQG